MRHYLDANATQPLRPEARAAALRALDVVGNPSSVHQEGRAARRLLEDAREAVAATLSARPAGVVFTSGATEANALALHALGAGRRIIASAIEHDSCRPASAEALPVQPDGRPDLDALAAMLRAAGPALVCLMLANNETGVIQPVAEAAALCRDAGARLHVDAVQAAGRIPLSLPALGAHSLALSGHKLGGPQGAGALILAPEIDQPLPLLAGGGQERGWRAGTPPLPAIAGLAAALTAAAPVPDHAAMRDAMEEAARAEGAEVAGAGAPRLANTTCLVLPGVRADAQVIALDLAGIAVSAGSACSSGKVAASHVLAAMGLGPQAGEAIRVSLPWNAGWEDVHAFTTAYAAMTRRLRSAMRAPLAPPPLAPRAA
jgi:cysteine desulfurase